MATLPRISVVTPSFNQGRFLARTIDSVLAQDYPDLEHIVVDGMSSDDTPELLARYRHLRVVREPDRGQSDAINKGFRLATGDILCFLNSDDTLLPGALHEVARRLDPSRGPHVVQGRCVHIDEDDRPAGPEHPSAFISHERVLEVWKGHWIPQPATFWTRRAWGECGPIDEAEQLVPDFDLMCRLSRRHPFEFIDRVLATYRLHTQSKTCSHTAEQIYARAIAVSRRYWGSPLLPRYWRLRASLAAHRFEQATGCRRRAAELAVRGYMHRALGRSLRGLADRLHAALLAPEAALRRSVGLLRGRLRTWGGPLSPLTRIWQGFAGVHGDQCAGPVVEIDFRREPGEDMLHLDGGPVLEWLPQPKAVEARIDGASAGRHPIPAGRPFRLTFPVGHLSPGPHRLTLTFGSFVVVDEYLGNSDYRPLTCRVFGVHAAASTAAPPAQAA